MSEKTVIGYEVALGRRLCAKRMLILMLEKSIILKKNQ